MNKFLDRFKIPTLLGLGIILAGIAGGVLLVLNQQGLILKAAPTAVAENIIITNISEDSSTISWQTDKEVTSFLTYGQNDPTDNTLQDERDQDTPQLRFNHYVSLKNLLPNTTYQFKIFTHQQTSETKEFTTTPSISDQNNFPPVIGSVLDGDQPLNEGIVYLSLAGAIPQSALIKTEGSFIIPLAKIVKEDQSGLAPLDGQTSAKLTVISDQGEASVVFYLKETSNLLSPLRIGQALDLRSANVEPNRFDLNGDGQINAADNAIILRNFGKNPKEKKADLNSDGVVDQKDLDLMSQNLNEQIK